jgi:hypothetical protein
VLELDDEVGSSSEVDRAIHGRIASSMGAKLRSAEPISLSARGLPLSIEV